MRKSRKKIASLATLYVAGIYGVSPRRVYLTWGRQTGFAGWLKGEHRVPFWRRRGPEFVPIPVAGWVHELFSQAHPLG